MANPLGRTKKPGMSKGRKLRVSKETLKDLAPGSSKTVKGGNSLGDLGGACYQINPNVLNPNIVKTAACITRDCGF